jgi:TPR repeat protein
MRHRYSCIIAVVSALLLIPAAFAQDEKPVIGINSFIIPAEDLEPLKTAALAGSGQAAYRLAQYYGFALLNFEEQLHWMTIAAENSDQTGIYGLGFLLAKKPDPASRIRARYWLEKSRDQGVEPTASLARQLLQELDARK